MPPAPPLGLFPEPCKDASRIGEFLVRLKDANAAAGAASRAMRPSMPPFPYVLMVTGFVLVGSMFLTLYRIWIMFDAVGHDPLVLDAAGLLWTAAAFALLAALTSLAEGFRDFAWLRRAGRTVTATLSLAAGIVCGASLLLAGAVIGGATLYPALLLPQTPQQAREERMSLLPDGSGVAMNGPFGFGVTDRLRAILDANPGARTLYLRSLGGLSSEGIAMGRLVRERGLKTVVHGYCGSACTTAFSQGSSRLAAGGEFGGLGYHPAFRMGMLLGAGKRVTSDPMKTGDHELRRSGMTDGFIGKANDRSPDDIWWPSSGELYEGRAIDGVSDRYALPSLSFMRAPQDRTVPLSEGWRAEVLKGHAPAVVAGLRAWMARGYEMGRNYPLMVEAFDRAVSRAMASALSTAGDAEVRKAGAYLADAMAKARLSSRAHCVRLGAYADLSDAADVSPHPAGSASDPDDPWGALFRRVLAGTRDLDWRPGAGPRDIGDASLWTPSSRALSPLTCEALVAWYGAASDIDDPGGASRLRALFARIGASSDAESGFMASDLPVP